MAQRCGDFEICFLQSRVLVSPSRPQITGSPTSRSMSVALAAKSGTSQTVPLSLALFCHIRLMSHDGTKKWQALCKLKLDRAEGDIEMSNPYIEQIAPLFMDPCCRSRVLLDSIHAEAYLFHQFIHNWLFVATTSLMVRDLLL